MGFWGELGGFVACLISCFWGSNLYIDGYIICIVGLFDYVGFLIDFVLGERWGLGGML